jgi:nucleoside-diphosphate-sugar epimerase
MTAGPRALVTGGAGFIGSHCLRYLAARDWTVRALDVHSAPAESLPRGVEFRVQDLRDTEALAAALDGVEIVFHLASVHLDVGASYREFESVNVQAVARLIEASAAAGVRRVVHVSSVGVYGHVTHPPANEQAPLKPGNDYERTKCAGEKAAMDAARRLGVDLVIIRPSWVYGAGCPRTAKLMSALRKKRFFYIGSSRNLRHPVFIDDFLESLLLAAAASREISGRIFNVAGPRWMTVQEMVGTFAAAMQTPPPRLRIPRWLGFTLGSVAEYAGSVLKINPPISRRTLAFFENDNAFDIAAARTALKFEPRVDLLEGVRRVLAEGSASTAA